MASRVSFHIDPSALKQLEAFPRRTTLTDTLRSAIANEKAIETLKPGWLMRRTEAGQLLLIPPEPARSESPSDSVGGLVYWPEARVANEATITGFGIAIGGLLAGHLGSVVGGATAFIWNRLRRRRA